MSGYGQQQFGQAPLGGQPFGRPPAGPAGGGSSQSRVAPGTGKPPADDDDVYGGFQSVDVNALRTATGRPSQAVVAPSGFGRPQPQASQFGTGGVPSGMGSDRPLTAIRGAGYTSHGTGRGGPLGTASGGRDSLFGGPGGGGGGSRAPSLQKKPDGGPEGLAREMERVVNRLVEESATAAVDGDRKLALERAKEAASKERALCRHRETNGMSESINIDLTYSVNLTLANAYHLNGRFSEALKTYQLIVTNKQYAQAGRLRVNMGNIHFEQREYPRAIKQYRMALDQVPTSGGSIRRSIQRNIANAFFAMGQYIDAISSFEAIIETTPDLQTSFNLLVCHFMLADRNAMKRVFADLVSLRPELDSGSSPDDPLALGVDDESMAALLLSPEEVQQDHAAAARSDELREVIKSRRARARRFVLLAAKLIAPVVEQRGMSQGYDYVIEALKSSPTHEKVAAEVEIAKALEHLKLREFTEAIGILRSFEKKDKELMAQASVNLSFLYFVNGDLAGAERHANIAVDTDRYNAKALVNRGNVAFARGDFKAARSMYADAVSVDAGCLEAVYNLGLAYKSQGLHDLALNEFAKCNTILPETPEVLYQLAECHTALGDRRQALKWLGHFRASGSHTDPAVLKRLAEMHDAEGDESQAYAFYQDSYRYGPSDIDVIAWLGGHCVRGELYERAFEYFTRAGLVQPGIPTWRLMAASCLRRIGQFREAFGMYEEIHAEFPDNVEALKYLVSLCKNVNLGLGDKADAYAAKLAKIEHSQKAVSAAAGQQQQTSSSTSSSASMSSKGGNGVSNGGGGGGGGQMYAKPASHARQAAHQEPQTHIDDEDLRNGGAGKKVRAGQLEDESWGDGALDELLPGT